MKKYPEVNIPNFIVRGRILRCTSKELFNSMLAIAKQNKNIYGPGLKCQASGEKIVKLLVKPPKTKKPLKY